MSDLQPILDLLPANAVAALTKLITTFLTVLGAARLLVKPLAAIIKGFIIRAAERASLSADPVDDTWVEAFLASRPYRAFAFLFSLVSSDALPSAHELFAKPAVAVPQ